MAVTLLRFGLLGLIVLSGFVLEFLFPLTGYFRFIDPKARSLLHPVITYLFYSAMVMPSGTLGILLSLRERRHESTRFLADHGR